MQEEAEKILTGSEQINIYAGTEWSTNVSTPV